MAGGNISSEKIDLLIYGPSKPIVDNGFSDQFVLHSFETTADLERLTPAVAEKIRGAAVTYNSVRGDSKTLARFPKLEIVSSFGVGYDHIDANYAREHNIVVTNTPDVLTEEVADVAMGLLIATLREFVKADRYLRSGLWLTQNFPLSVGSLRDRTVGMVGMGRIGQAIARRLEASRVPVVYHSRKPADGVSYKHYPDLIEMAKAVDTLVVIVPGGAGTAKMVNADVMKALGPRGVIINVARGSVVDEQALIAALKSGDHSCRGSRCLRKRAERAGRIAQHAECRFAATYWLGFSGNAQCHGSAGGRQSESLVCRQAAADAGCGNPGEEPLMARRFGIALAALMAWSPALGAGAGCLDAEEGHGRAMGALDHRTQQDLRGHAEGRCERRRG